MSQKLDFLKLFDNVVRYLQIVSAGDGSPTKKDYELYPPSKGAKEQALAYSINQLCMAVFNFFRDFDVDPIS